MSDTALAQYADIAPAMIAAILSPDPWIIWANDPDCRGYDAPRHLPTSRHLASQIHDDLTRIITLSVLPGADPSRCRVEKHDSPSHTTSTVLLCRDLDRAIFASQQIPSRAMVLGWPAVVWYGAGVPMHLATAFFRACRQRQTGDWDCGAYRMLIKRPHWDYGQG